MEFFASQFLNGLIIGLIYALMSIGLTMIFSVLKVVNFAHGEFYMLGGFFTYYLVSSFGLSPLIGIPLAVTVVFFIGMLLEYLLLQPIFTGAVERKDEYAILMTFALSIFLQNLSLALFGPWTKGMQSFFPGELELGFFAISWDRIFAATAAFAMLMVFYFITKFTYIGKAIRAVSQDRQAATLLGIDSDRVNYWGFGIGAALAATGGALMGPIFLVSASMGTMPGIKSFVIIVLGGMGSINGSLLGSLILGQVETLGSAYFPDLSRGLAYKNFFGLIILSIVLLIKPTGLFGERHVRME